MKKKWVLAFVLMALLLSACGSAGGKSESSSGNVPQAAGSVPFSKGIATSDWFSVLPEWDNTVSSWAEQDFANLKKLGIDVVRLFLTFDSRTDGSPHYNLEPFIFTLLDQAVAWAEKYQIYIIFCYVSTTGKINTVYTGEPPTTEADIERLLKIWPQVAEHYKNQSDYVLYEIFNEPNNIPAKRWGQAQGEVIDAIRRVDQKHTIVVTSTNWSHIEDLFSLPKYADNNLIYTFHFYEPSLFVVQGTQWGGFPSLTGVPFPYDKAKMPELPHDLRGTYVEGLYKNYGNDSSPQAITRQLDRAVEFSKDRNAPLFVGEWGACSTVSVEDRLRCNEFIANEMNKRNIPWTFTDADIIDQNTVFNIKFDWDFNTNLNVDLLRVMGFTPIPQQSGALRDGFTIYDDYFIRRFTVSYWPFSPNVFTRYDMQAAEGKYAIRWGNLNQNNGGIAIYFGNYYGNTSTASDFSWLAQNGYYLEFKARTERAVRFQVYFQMPENDSSIPWRMAYDIDNNTLPPDGKWHTIKIPLGNMKDSGAWISSTEQWLNSQGKFSWNQVARLQFEANENISNWIWLDDIQIVK